VNFTGVASRHVTAISGILLVGLGIVPKVGALLSTIPAAAIGGGGLIMFAMIFASGLSILHRDVVLDRRTLVILAVAIGLGLGVELRPAVLGHLPEGVRVFLGSGLITGGITALLLNLLLPREIHGLRPTGSGESR
jgi:NCS2 family nucleobase:cation symporter-2